MSPDEQRIALADYQGVDVRLLDVCKCGEPVNGGCDNHHPVPIMTMDDLPVNDLEGMQKLVSQLDDVQLERFGRNLQEVDRNWVLGVYISDDQAFRSLARLANATVFSRREAFLKTVGKWKSASESQNERK